MFSGEKKQRKRRKRGPRRKKTSFREEYLDTHCQTQEDQDASAEVEEEAKKRLEAVRKEVEGETEAFIWNLSFGLVAVDLVKFIEERIATFARSAMASSDRSSTPVVRCQILMKDNRSKGCAVVIFKSRSLFDYFLQQSKSPGHILAGRRIQVKEGDGQSKHRRSRGYSRYSSCTMLSFQLGWSPTDDEEDGDHKSPFVASWQYFPQGDDSDVDTKLTIDGSSRSLTLSFRLNNIPYLVEHSITNIRDLQLERSAGDDGQLVLAFRVTEAPRMSLDDRSRLFHTTSTEASVDSFFEGAHDPTDTLADLLAGMTADRFVWELFGIFGLNERWVRTTDPTTTNSFGRCFSYRVTVNTKGATGEDLRRSLVEDLKAFRLLRQNEPSSSSPWAGGAGEAVGGGGAGGAGGSSSGRNRRRQRQQRRSSTAAFEVAIAPPRKVVLPPKPPLRRPMAEEAFFQALMSQASRGLSFSVLYALHCLVGANKVDLESALRDRVTVPVATPSRKSTTSASTSASATANAADTTSTSSADAASASSERAYDYDGEDYRGDSGEDDDLDLYTGTGSSTGSRTGSVLVDAILAMGSDDMIVAVIFQLLNDDSVPFIPDLKHAFLSYLERFEPAEEEEEEGDDEDEGAGDLGATVMMRRVLITPTRICPQPSEPEPSNRVIRQFSKHLDRFLRVTFVDENFGSFYQVSSSQDIIEKRLRVTINSGIWIAGQKYKLLAFSNSQIREQSCWFYDESKRPGDIASPPTAKYIRGWIGDLSSIRVVGKHAARLGQGFSSTVPALTVPARDFEVIPDVKRNGFCFSDGVGMISQSSAADIAKKLVIPRDHIPSAFQIRFGGGKGMLTVMPDSFLPRRLQIAFRPSMMKFESQHRELEINSIARVMPFYLNRQLITILTSRGVREDAILKLVDDMTRELDAALRDDFTALCLLYRHGGSRIGGAGNYHPGGGGGGGAGSPLAAAFHMLKSGMSVATDPYIYGIVTAVRNKLLIDIQTKARILVPCGVCLLGVMDETGTLQPGEVFIQLSPERLSNRLEGQVPRPEGVLTCASVGVGRSPSLHPGDVRVLKPVDVPALHHLFDVVVFPSLGPRPHPNEMSGGDLDGDIYFIFWDKSLIPKTDYSPMDYTASTKPPVETKSPDGVVSIEEIGNFFVDYIKNDNLGMIANAWMVYADLSGAGCAQCLQLAQLHSTAVDFAKTGVPAELPTSLRTTKCPSFMESRFKPEYESNSVLGKIYRICKEIQHDTTPFFGSYNSRSGRVRDSRPLVVDRRLIVDGCKEFIDDQAWTLLEGYNQRLWEIMHHYGVFNEMEALSGFATRFSRKMSPSESKGGGGGRGGKETDVQARLNEAVKNLRLDFTEYFWEDVRLKVGLGTTMAAAEAVIAAGSVVPTPADGGSGIKKAAAGSATAAAGAAAVAADPTLISRRRCGDYGDDDQEDVNAVDYYDRHRAMQKASAWYYCSYSQQPFDPWSRGPPLVSFPWIVFSLLCEVKKETRNG